jgi:hypothetical protein
MPQLAPVVKTQYTDEERAVIAGYLLHRRQGLLKALASVDLANEISVDGYFVKTFRYYKIAEAWNRFELFWIGYETPKNQLYTP